MRFIRFSQVRRFHDINGIDKLFMNISTVRRDGSQKQTLSKDVSLSKEDKAEILPNESKKPFFDNDLIESMLSYYAQK